MRLLALVLFALAACVAVAEEAEEYSPLYSSSVLILSEANFTDTVYNCNDTCTSLVVEFYRSTSAASQEYFEGYKKAASDAKPWKFIRFANVDCNTNEELCETHGFKRMPLLKYFKRKTETGDLGEKIPTYVKKDDLLVLVASKMRAEHWSNSYPDWPNFSQVVTSNIDDLWNEFKKCTKQIFVIPVNNIDDPNGMSNFVVANNYANGTFPIVRVEKDHPLVTMQNLRIFPKTNFMVYHNNLNTTECPDAGLPTYKQFITKLGDDPKNLDFSTKHYNNSITIERYDFNN